MGPAPPAPSSLPPQTATFDLSSRAARFLGQLRWLAFAPAAIFAPLALAGWYGVLTGDPSALGLAFGFSAVASGGTVVLLLLYVVPPDPPIRFTVSGEDLRVGFRRGQDRTLRWTDPSSGLLVADTSGATGPRAGDKFPVLIHVAGSIEAWVPLGAFEALKTEMEAHGFGFVPVLGRGTRRLSWGLPFSTTLLAIERETMRPPPVRAQDPADPLFPGVP
ncbi:MAG: hypothetical protein L3K13_01555 [Thermoplasmata archaeon]|nr:hypothetical protein [Thermoplasmata archaeon]